MSRTRLRPALLLLALILLVSSAPSVFAGSQPLGSAEGRAVMRPPQQGGRSSGADTGTVTAPVEVVEIVPNSNAMVSPIFAVDVRNQDFDMLTTTTPLATRINPNFPGAYLGGDFANNDFTQLYAVNAATNMLVRINVATSAVTPVGSMGAPVDVGTWIDLSFDPTTGTMYALSDSNTTGPSVYTVNLVTGAATWVATNGSAAVWLMDAAIHPTTGVMYAIDIGANTLVRLNKTTAAATTVGPLGINPDFAQGMDFEDATGILYWAAYRGAAVGPGQLRTINTTTGASTLIGPITNGVAGETVQLDAFAVASPSLAVTLATFDATLRADGTTRVRWQTVSEVDTLGFHLWRSSDEGAPAERLTAAMIPTQAGGGSQGAAYEWVDTSAGGTAYYYWLEDIETSGTSTLHGPVLAQPEVPTAITLGTLEGAAPSPVLPLLALGALALAAGLLLRRRGS